MKTKLEMAHEHAMTYMSDFMGDLDTLVSKSWQYADKMQAEADKREIKPFREEGYSLPPKRPFFKPKEWQPDWSQAADGYDWWAMDADGNSCFFSYEPYFVDDSDYWADYYTHYQDGRAEIVNGAFDYKGDWRESLRKRPE